MEATASTITISQAWGWLIAACAAIVTLAKAWEIVRNWGPGSLKKQVSKLQTDIADARTRIQVLEDAGLKDIIRKHGELLQKDDERLKALEDAYVMTMQTMLALVQHEIDGNNTQALIDTRDSLQTYLINRRR